MPEQPDVALGLQMEALVGAANRLVCAACGANVVCLKASVLDAACRAFIVLRASARMDPRAWWKQKVDKEKAKVERLREGRW